MLFFNVNSLTRTGIATNTRIALFDRERSEATKFDPVAACHCTPNLFEDGIHDTFDIPLIQMWIFISDLLDQLGTDHGSTPQLWQRARRAQSANYRNFRTLRKVSACVVDRFFVVEGPVFAQFFS